MRLQSKLRAGNEDLVVLIGDEERFTEGVKQSLLLVSAADWNRDLSPWPAEKVFKNGEAFAGGADETIDELCEMILPYRETYRTITLAGYSLAGLFALYACTRTDLFDQCLSASGSLWYPGWIEYLKEHRLMCRKVYLSLGDTEKKTRNPVMAKVEENTLITEQLIGKYAEVIREMNPGNHFQDPAGRICRGIRRLCA